MTGKITGGEFTPKQFWIDGKEVTEAEFRETFPDRPFGDGSGLIGWKPIISDALAVHPDQVKEAEALAKARGVPTDFLPDGRPVLRSRQHRKAYMQAHGFFDRQAGYGDAQPGGYKGSDKRPKDPEPFTGE